jgi:hypothetical protein
MTAKVHPQGLPSSASSYISSKQETFTIWMKSLVFGGKGCTVFDAKGQIVYRVDNYSRKCRDEVYLMDFKGKVIFTILRKVNKKKRLLNSIILRSLDSIYAHNLCFSFVEIQIVQVLGGLQIHSYRG